MEIAFGLFISVEKAPLRLGEFMRDFLDGAAPQGSGAGAQRDVLPLPVIVPEHALVWEREMKKKGLLSQRGAPVDLARWPEELKQEAQQLTFEVWFYLAVMGLNYLYLGHLSKDRWHYVGELSKIQEASLAALEKAVSWFVRGALDPHPVPDWTTELAGKRSNYNLDEDCRALPLVYGELEPGLPKKEDIGKLDILQYVSPTMAAWLADPRQVLLPEESWPDEPPTARVNVKDPRDWWEVAKALVDVGLLEPIAERDIFRAKGRRVTNGFFAVPKSGEPAAGQARVTRLIFNMIPTNAYMQNVVEDTATLVPSPAWVSISLGPGEVLLWSGDDQKGAFFMYRLPAAWRPMMTACTPVPGHVLGVADKEVWLAMTVLPMGWVLSVPIFQCIHRRLALERPPAGAALPPAEEWRRDQPVPRAAAAPRSHGRERSWWSTYIDDFDNPEIFDAVTASELEGTPGALQARMRGSYARNHVPTSAGKANLRQAHVTRMGVEVDGRTGRLANNRKKNIELLSLTLWCIGQERLIGDQLLVLLGRWVRALEFRRPLFGIFAAVWEQLRTCAHRLSKGMIDELLHACIVLSLASANLRAEVTGVVSCSDASEFAAGMCTATRPSANAERFFAKLGAPHEWSLRIAGFEGKLVVEPAEELRKLEGRGQVGQPRVLLVSLFDGIGGAAVSLVRAGFSLAGYISSEVDKGCRRVARTRWPGLIEYGDIEEITPQMLEALKLYETRAHGVVVIGGSPCQDLSGVNADRVGLSGSRSGLFYRIPAIVAALQKTLSIPVHWLVENVASMSAVSVSQFTEALGVRPVKLCNSVFTDNRRPRLFWTSWNHELLAGLDRAQVVERAAYDEVVDAGVPRSSEKDWLASGARRLSGGKPLCCFLRRVEKKAPYKPAGLEGASEGARALWAGDAYAYPPYQYEPENLIVDAGGSVRTPKSEERELLLGFPRHYTSAVASSGSSPGSVETERCAQLGNSFSCFAVAWLLLGLRAVLGRPAHAGLKASITAVLEAKDLLDERTEFVAEGVEDTPFGKQIVELFFTVAERAGSDVRLDVGLPFRPKAWPRASIDPALWRWKPTLSFPWPKDVAGEHINALELRAVNASLRRRTRATTFRSVKCLHLVDSQVVASILTRGRTSSGKLRGLARQYSAIVVASDLYVAIGYVNTKINPSDAPSRLKVKRARCQLLK